MKTKPLFILIGLGVILSALMLVIGLAPTLTKEEPREERRLDPNWVRGAAAISGVKPYTLALNEQIAFINLVNSSEPFTETAPPVKLAVSKVSFYRFPPQSEVGILFKGSVNNKIVMQVSGLASVNLLIEKEPGQVKKWINELVLQ